MFIYSENNKISVYNNGKGIPIVEHKDEKMFVPSLIFGHLLTSSNYNDNEKKVTGGRNGYGAKLCNIFSKEFIVETSSKADKKSFKQVWKDNMGSTQDAVIKDSKGDDFTKITFRPDLSKFKMTSLDKDIVALFTRRAYDVAGSTKGVKVYLNGSRLSIKSFKDYVDFYLKGKTNETGEDLKCAFEDVNPRWQVAVALSDKGFQQISFVNSIATTKGGRHVDHVADQLIAKLAEAVKKKNKAGVNIKPHQLRNHIWVFVNCLIENPTFDSQTKETMTLQPKSFGSKCSPSDKFFNEALKLGIVESIMSWVQFKAQQELNKKCSSRKHTKVNDIPKLDDANEAGGKNSKDCTLILTEGDSAKTLVVAGFGVIGRDKYGVFPLRGKLLNVREATHKQIMENAEINHIIKIMGLQYKKKYETEEDLKTLRYGKLMIMTDQDQDGSHIKGLLINFIHHNWPSLLKLPFLEEFITPIVRVSKGKNVISFYSLPEFEEWKKETRDAHTWKVKYYKGLGTSTSNEAKEYFSNLARHRITFNYKGPEDDESVELAFSKKMVESRKDWLLASMEEKKRRRELGLPDVYLYEKNTKSVSYHDFVNKELVLFSNLDNERSIPSLVDGLKPGQRKIMFTCFKKNLKNEMKVAQLAGAVGELSAYHHGEASLVSTIVNLAQNFVGSNNINLLLPLGQFGTRLQGGKDSASARYIFTKLSPLARKIFSTLDDPLLNYLYDDNQKVEPEYYVPIIPMVLVNGSEGIGTGWSTKIPNFNPRDLVNNLKRMINNEEPLPMKPWFKGYQGVIEQVNPHKYVTNGEAAIIDDGKMEITELPIRIWTQTYKENVLIPMLEGSDKQPATISDFREYHTDSTVRFLITMPQNNLSKAEEQGIHKVFKLQTTFSTTFMVLFDAQGCIKKYESAEDILKEFFQIRIECYRKRKAYLEGMLSAEALKLMNQARFILQKNKGEIKLENRKKKDFLKQLIELKYDSDPVKEWMKRNKLNDSENRSADQDKDDEQEESKNEDIIDGYDFDYLKQMSLESLLIENVDKLLKKRDEKKKELDDLRATTVEQLWLSDLDAFLAELDSFEKLEAEEAEKALKVHSASSKMIKSKSGKVDIQTKPSLYGRRIEPAIDYEFYKKKEEGVKKSSDGVKKVGRTKKDGLSKGASKDTPIVLDDEDVPLSERLSNKDKENDSEKEKGAGKKLKQTTLNFKPISKDSDSKSVEEELPKREILKRKATKSKYNFSSSEDEDTFDFDDEDDDDYNDDFDNNDESFVVSKPKKVTASRKPRVTKKAQIESDDEDDLRVVGENDKETLSPVDEVNKEDVDNNVNKKVVVEEKDNDIVVDDMDDLADFAKKGDQKVKEQSSKASRKFKNKVESDDSDVPQAKKAKKVSKKMVVSLSDDGESDEKPKVLQYFYK